MFNFERQEPTELEMNLFIQESLTDESNKLLREQIIDPIIEVLETPTGRNRYIEFGSEFLESNALMLSREYPSAQVSYPRAYVDNILHLFGFNLKDLKATLKTIMSAVNDKTDFNSILATPTNVIHSVVLFYSDIIIHRQLRDSAKQQLGLSVYNNILNKFFSPPHPNPNIMGYTYNQLDNSWGIVKSENVINWIGSTVETSYAFYRTKLTISMSAKVLIEFLNRLRNSFNQNIRLLAGKYYDNLTEGNMVGGDVEQDAEYLDTTNTNRYRDLIIQRIKTHDHMYFNKDGLYPGIARLKNVKLDSLYSLAMEISHKDIGIILDTIFYVFIVKEGFGIADINSTKYISRITNIPTAVDRATEGKPVIKPLVKKYKTEDLLVKAYICFLATYLMYSMNELQK